MWGALEISKDILDSQPTVVGGSNGTEIWNFKSQHPFYIIPWFE
jgi:hypothetical protein